MLIRVVDLGRAAMTTGDAPGNSHARRSRLAGIRPGPKYVTAAVVGLAVVAGGIYLLLGDRHQDVTAGAQEPSASPPMPHASAAAVSAAPLPRGTSASAPRAAGTASRTGSPAARSATPGFSHTSDTTSSGGVNSRTVALPTGQIQLTWAKTNLLGQREQNLAADNGRPVGKARCTQKLKVNGGQVKESPNMMLCWRTSAARSVLAFQIAATGAPSADTSVKLLNEQWAKIG
jgi:hypothetical protein